MDKTLAEVRLLERFAEGYFKWICGNVDPDRQYTILLEHLFELEFVWIHEYDVNRYEDGCNLRLIYEQASGEKCYDNWVDWPCSILEMIYGLAVKIETIMYDISSGEDRTSEWFWTMIDNLGLGICTDREWKKDPGDALDYVQHRIDMFLQRNYDEFGDGSLFPMGKSTPKNWSETEIWEQMCAFYSPERF